MAVSDDDVAPSEKARVEAVIARMRLARQQLLTTRGPIAASNGKLVLELEAKLEQEEAMAASVNGQEIHFRGVSKSKTPGRWDVKIMHEGTCYCLGTFTDQLAAARAYDAKARELKGDRARVNFPDEAPAAAPTAQAEPQRPAVHGRSALRRLLGVNAAHVEAPAAHANGHRSEPARASNGRCELAVAEPAIVEVQVEGAELIQELACMRAVLDALLTVPPAVRGRVLRWTADRMGLV